MLNGYQLCQSRSRETDVILGMAGITAANTSPPGARRNSLPESSAPGKIRVDGAEVAQAPAQNGLGPEHPQAVLGQDAATADVSEFGKYRACSHKLVCVWSQCPEVEIGYRVSLSGKSPDRIGADAGCSPASASGKNPRSWQESPVGCQFGSRYCSCR